MEDMALLTMLKRAARRTIQDLRLQPQGERGIKIVGHRQYVGGAWDEIGKLQFDWLISQGMLPHHYLLDIACGSLRLGVHAIPYLDRGRYLGIDKEQSLIDAGLALELPADVAREKQPQLIQSSDFAFDRFDQQPDFAMAQSLFTHLTPDIINLCFARLRPRMKPESKFYATYFLARPETRNPKKSHDHGHFFYSQDEMRGFGTDNGFRAEYIGNWGHPRKQVMVRYTV